MINLWLDDYREPPKGEDWEWAQTYSQAIDLMLDNEVGHMALDHDLGYDREATHGQGMETGHDFVKWMIENNRWPKYVPVVHSWNPSGAKRMTQDVDKFGPFGKPCQYRPSAT